MTTLNELKTQGKVMQKKKKRSEKILQPKTSVKGTGTRSHPSVNTSRCLA